MRFVLRASLSAQRQKGIGFSFKNQAKNLTITLMLFQHYNHPLRPTHHHCLAFPTASSPHRNLVDYFSVPSFPRLPDFPTLFRLSRSPFSYRTDNWINRDSTGLFFLLDFFPRGKLTGPHVLISLWPLPLEVLSYFWALP